MKLTFCISIAFLYLLLVGCGEEKRVDAGKSSVQNSEPPLFTLLSPQQTGIQFQNQLTEGLNTNILMYEYFYNGGGVAIGDLNNDKLLDIYFTANMSDNKLYLNKGNMQFEDITVASKAGGRPGPWKTGVTMVDINGDDKLDIYVSYSGALPEPKRANQLFINQGNDPVGIPQFVEEAAEYGLASTAFSNQAYFFDYDKDGDLDALLLNHNPKNLPVLNVANTKEFLKIDDPQRGIRLYEQDQGSFKDVTQKAGISGSALSYGLGLGITDANKDGWPDFYISNDYAVPDYLYINQQNGSFTNKLNESMGHNSHFSMGNDVADVNNDGLQDIITLDMLPEDNFRQKLLLSPDNYAKFDLNVKSGFHYQYMRNMLQLNNGDGTYSEIGQLAGISNTDWSWAALLADYDNDGWKDLFITNGYKRDYTNLDFIKYMDSYVQSKGRLVREDVLDIISHMPASNVVNYMFNNENGQRFTNVTHKWGVAQASNSNGAAYADLDNDGDLDLVVNNINQTAFIYQNESREQTQSHYLSVMLKGEGMNTQGLGANVDIYANGKRQSLVQIPTRGYLSSVSPVLHVGLGEINKIDTLEIEWMSGKKQWLYDVQADQIITLFEKDASTQKIPTRPSKAIFTESNPPIDYEYPTLEINDFYRQPLLISEFSFSGPSMAKGDLNGDGKEDVLVGGAIGQETSLYLQTGNSRFIRKNISAFEADLAHEDAALAIFDANGDGHADIYIASGGYHNIDPRSNLLQDRLYLNDGQANFSKAEKALPPMPVSTATVAVHDIDGDGDTDVFAGSRVIPGRYPETPESYLLINDGKGSFSDQTQQLAPELAKAGMITDAAWTDLDGDNRAELIVVGEWMPVSVFGMRNAKLENRTSDFFDKAYKGWWNTLTITDINKDQKPDLLIGNMGTNTQFSVSDAEPAEMYYSDFDNNGAVDPIFCYYIQGISYPYVTRDELLQQLVSLRSRFTSYESFAGVTMEEIFGAEGLAKAGYLEANHMQTSLFLSNGSGKYSLSELPIQAQYSPIYTISVLDYDADGHKDLLLCGNNSHTKLRLGKFDANYGCLLKGDGKGGFQYIPQTTSGLQLRGDVRSVIQLNDKWLFGINQGTLISYELIEKAL